MYKTFSSTSYLFKKGIKTNDFNQKLPHFFFFSQKGKRVVVVFVMNAAEPNL
jgi:hypothetical protein